MLRPSFVGPAGVAAHPLHAAGPQPRIDLAGLARLFVTPVLFGEFAPGSFWEGVDLDWPMPEPAAEATPLAEEFAAAVARACADADMVAVALSGGIDSIAVAWHAAQLDRRVIAFVVDLVDDTGMGAASAVAPLLDEFGLAGRVELRVVDPATCMLRPGWSPFGPRMDALPQVNATVAALAADAGAQVLLSGNGADELLSAPRYAAAEVAAVHGAAAAHRYLADMAGAGYGRLGEAAGLSARLLPPGARARAYAAVTWPDWCAPQASPILAAAWHEQALTWARTWVTGVLDGHAAAGRSWAAMDALDSWWPRAFLPPAGPITESSPFCDARFDAVVWAHRLGERYDPAGPSPYLRVKGAVAGLFPPPVRRLLPAAKRYYAGALAAVYADPVTVPVAAKAGLLDPSAVATSTCTATRMMAAAVEAWLAGAADAGIGLGELCRTSTPCTWSTSPPPPARTGRSPG